MPKRKQKRGGTKRYSSLPIEDFFEEYSPRFEYDPTESASHEFYRLCDELGWVRGDEEREQAHREFKNALVKQFNEVYGTDEDDLRDWQNVCHAVNIDPVPDDLFACQEAVRGTYVNLVDLVDAKTTGEDVQIFDTELELSQYTKSTGKYFPKENAYAGGLLRYLLRHILNPAAEASPRRRYSRRR